MYGLDYCNNEKVKVTSVKKISYMDVEAKDIIIYPSYRDRCLWQHDGSGSKVISNDYTPPVIYYTDELLKLIYIDNSNTIHVDCENYEYFLELIRNNSGVLVTDNCQTNISPLFEQIEGSTRCTSEEIIKEYLFRWTATDVCGNKAELNLKVIMSTPNKPDFSFVPADVTVHCEELAPLPVQYPELGCGFTGLEYAVRIRKWIRMAIIQRYEHGLTQMCVMSRRVMYRSLIIPTRQIWDAQCPNT